MVQLLEAGGVEAADRDVGASGRELALFFIDEDTPLWQQVLTVMRTAGPRARLVELGDGRLRFRDEPVPAVARTIRGRLSGLGAGGLVSRVDHDDAGRSRVVNTVELEYYEGGAAGISQVGSVFEGDSDASTHEALSTVTAAGVLAVVPAAGDTLISFLAAGARGARRPYRSLRAPRYGMAAPSAASSPRRGRRAASSAGWTSPEGRRRSHGRTPSRPSCAAAQRRSSTTSAIRYRRARCCTPSGARNAPTSLSALRTSTRCSPSPRPPDGRSSRARSSGPRTACSVAPTSRRKSRARMRSPLCPSSP